MPSLERNPFAPKLPPTPPDAPLSESSRRILEDINEELAKPTEEKTFRLASAAHLEKTERHPAIEAARKLAEDEEEIIEGEPIEEGRPALEGFQTEGEIAQEKLQAVQAKAEGSELGLDTIDPRNPASLKEGTKRVVDSILGSPEEQKALEYQLGLVTGKLSLERARLETLIKDKVAVAALALRSKVKPTFQIVDELRAEITKLARKL